jgi:hypothetical protein
LSNYIKKYIDYSNELYGEYTPLLSHEIRSLFMKKSFLLLFLLLFSLPPASTYGREGKCIEGDCFNGKGAYLFSDGDKYIGEFKNAKFFGQGTYTSSDGKEYVGEWEDDFPNGKGTYTLPNGEKYVGEFKNGKSHGQGTFTSPSGEVYVGEWKDNYPNGTGSLTLPDGEKYEGGFKNGKYNGLGTLELRDGLKYEGGFQDGQKHGKGFELDSSGKVKIGYWLNDSYVGREMPTELEER